MTDHVCKNKLKYKIIQELFIEFHFESKVKIVIHTLLL